VSQMEFDEGFGQFSKEDGDSQSMGAGSGKRKLFCVDDRIELGEILEKLQR
jgi:hypothetical protein